MEFQQWLAIQRNRTDLTGDLARQLLADPLSPCWSNRLSTYRSYLRARNAGIEITNALQSTFCDWRRNERRPND